MIWLARRFQWDLSSRGLVMGILNVTPDSFSDGGRFLEQPSALEQARHMVAQGADILDVGGESTRPGAAPVDESTECARVLPVIEALVSEFPEVALSVDTSKSAVAAAALEAGAHIINDVTGLLGDPRMAEVAAASEAGLVLMHMQGQPRTMQDAPVYENVIAEIRAFLEAQGQVAIEAGVTPSQLVFDPGIGFGKALTHNLEILRHLDALTIWNRPILLGASRKSFIGRILASEAMESRRWPTVALTAYAMEIGARIVRVHDVEPNVQAMRMTEAILHAACP